MITHFGVFYTSLSARAKRAEQQAGIRASRGYCGGIAVSNFEKTFNSEIAAAFVVRAAMQVICLLDIVKPQRA